MSTCLELTLHGKMLGNIRSLVQLAKSHKHAKLWILNYLRATLAIMCAAADSLASRGLSLILLSLITLESAAFTMTLATNPPKQGQTLTRISSTLQDIIELSRYI